MTKSATNIRRVKNESVLPRTGPKISEGFSVTFVAQLNDFPSEIDQTMLCRVALMRWPLLR